MLGAPRRLSQGAGQPGTGALQALPGVASTAPGPKRGWDVTVSDPALQLVRPGTAPVPLKRAEDVGAGGFIQENEQSGNVLAQDCARPLVLSIVRN